MHSYKKKMTHPNWQYNSIHMSRDSLNRPQNSVLNYFRTRKLGLKLSKAATVPNPQLSPREVNHRIEF